MSKRTEPLGIIKSHDEIKRIKKAQAMGDKCFSHLLEFITPGMTETHIAAEIEETFRKLGASGTSFAPICASAERGALPHAVPTSHKIKEGDLLTIDMGAMADGYAGDMTRTIGIGYLTDEQKKLYDIVLRAQLEGIEKAGPSVKACDVDKACRDIIEEEGFGEYFIHGTGHGVGRQVHEPPTVNSNSEEILRPGMPITIEPGIYIPKSMGVRIEDLLIITEIGILNITKSTKELVII